MLQIKNLSVSYGSILALSNITMEINEGSLVALIGANGAGKSTLISAISGLVEYEGSIHYKGRPLSKVPSRIVNKGIVQIPEGRLIFSNLTVYENLLCGAYSCWNKQKIAGNLKRVYGLFPVLEERREQMAGTLSGGQRQMLAIGRGLMSEPQVLLIDEPSLGLAPLLTQQVLDLVVEINKQAVTILLVEQNARKSLSIADYAYVLQNGRLVEEGTGTELLNKPAIQKAYLGGKIKK